jgi:hypothetical protein
VGSSGTASALLSVGVEAGVGLSASEAGCKAPRSWMASPGCNADWVMAAAAAVCLAPASTAPNAKDNPIAQTMILVESNCLDPRRSVCEKPTISNDLKTDFVKTENLSGHNQS